MDHFLVLYDYGQGGVWAVVEADSELAITSSFPELKVFADRPSWMSDAHVARLQEQAIDLDHTTGLLADILKSRSK